MATYLQMFMSKVYPFFVSLCFVLEIQSTFLNIEELQKSKYGVEISAEPVLLNNEKKDGSIMQITSKHGQQYQCVLPIVHFKTKELNIVNVTTEEINGLLEPLNDTCLYLLNGWWSYRVCIGKFVHQYHDEGHQVKDNISLGHFSGDTDWSKVTIKEETSGDKRYHSQFYSNGTVCDLTGQPRNTEVRFFCNVQGSDYISRIDESSTCVYVITIYTNKLCNHSLFRPPPKPQKHSITCSPALVEDQYKKYAEAQQKTKEELAVSNSDDIDNDEHNQNRRTPDIVEGSLGKMYHKENIKETKHGPELKTKQEKNIDWVDVFKTSERIIKQSLERANKLQREKESSQDESDEDEISEGDDDDDTTDDEDEIYGENEESGSYSKMKKLKAKSVDDVENGMSNEKEDDDLDREDNIGWDEDNMDEVDDSVGNEGSSTLAKKNMLSSIFSNNKKQKKNEKDDYYQELIDHLKVQYEHYKKQLDSMTNDMNKKIRRLEDSAGPASPTVKVLVNAIKMSVKRLEDKQRVAEDAMRRLTELYDAVMEDPDYLNAKEELASIRSTLVGLIETVKSKPDSSERNDDTADNDDYDESKGKKRQLYKPSIRTEEIFKTNKARKVRDLDMEAPKLDKVVSKLKKLMTRESVEDLNREQDQHDDDRISVRVTKIKEKSEDIYDDKNLEKSFLDEEDEINGNEELKAATKKMESIVRKQLEDSGVNHEGKIKVKIITSKEALQRVAGGEEKFQILTPQETNQFKDLLSNLLGGTQELMKEKKRQEVMEDNYNLVWNQDGFTSARVNKEQTSTEHEDNDENS